MNGPFSELAKYGRGGDNRDAGGMVAHINAQEAALLKAMGGRGTINPATGLPEFDFGDGSMSDPGGGGFGGYGGGGDFGGGGGPSSDGYLPGEPVALPDGTVVVGPVNPGSYHDSNNLPDWAAQPPTPAYRPSFLQDPAKNLGIKADNFIANIRDNPFTSALDFAAGFIPGVGILNTISGWLDGPTLGKGITSVARSASGYGDDDMQNMSHTGIAAGGGASPPGEPGMSDGRESNGPDQAGYTAMPGQNITAPISANAGAVAGPMQAAIPGEKIRWTQPGFDWTKYGYQQQQRFFDDFDPDSPFGGRGAQIVRGPFG